MRALLRGDFNSQQLGYKTAVEGGWMTPNQVRDLEDMDPMPAEYGDLYYRPLNTAPVNGKTQINNE